MNTPSPTMIQLVDIFNHDLSLADDNKADGQVTTVWNLPRDMKTDVAIVLQASVEAYNLTNRIAVVKSGIFEESKLRDKTSGKTRTVVTVARTADVAKRMSLGEIDGHYQAGDPRLTANNADGSPTLLAAGGGATLRNQASDVSVDVSIYDLNEMIADQVYLFVKTVMFAAEDAFAGLGYIKPPIRVAGSDSGSVLDLDGGAKFVYNRTLSYQGEHLDYIGAIDKLARLIAVTGATDASLDPDGQAKITVDLS